MTKQAGQTVGRPSSMTEATVSKLIEAFAKGCTDIEACLYAGINRQTLYRYQQDNPEFVTRKEELKESPVLLARCKVIESIKDDVKTAQWYLERKNAKEFAAKSQVDVTHTHRLDDVQLLDTFSKLLQGVGSGQVIDAEYTEQQQIEHDDQA